ncbi:MAG: squalene/phytoene synthase family protein, partial [Casimicrobiaceae bacterium]
MPTENPCLSVGHYENFPVASALLPRRLRTAVVAIYRFARAADDIADEGDHDNSTRLALLDIYRDNLESIAQGRTPAAPLFTA